jgi:cell division protein FtsB
VASGRNDGAGGEADGVAAVRPAVRPRPARGSRLHRARRLGALALLVLLVVLCVGPIRSYLRARSATQQLRTDVARLDREHARLKAEIRSASRTTTLIAQARAAGYIRPGEKPFTLAP